MHVDTNIWPLCGAFLAVVTGAHGANLDAADPALQSPVNTK